MNDRTRSTRAALCMLAITAMFALSACGGDDDSSSSAASVVSSDNATTDESTSSESTSESTPTSNSATATVGSVSLQWVAPQENTDGSALQDLAGYTVVYGTSADTLDQSIRIDNPSIDRYVVEQLPAGTYYFAVRAHNADGAESNLSNVVSRVVG